MSSFAFPYPLVSLNHFGFQFLIPDPDSIKELYQQGNMDFPYWSRIWPSAIALSEWIQQEPALIQGMTVLEIGAGIGLPSFVSSAYARKVIVTDHQDNAVALMNSNIQANGIRNITAKKLDWRFDQILPSEIYLLSDVNYEPVSLEALKNMIDEIMERGANILLSTPQRITAVSFVESIDPYILSSHVRSVEGIAISLYRLGKSN